MTNRLRKLDIIFAVLFALLGLGVIFSATAGGGEQSLPPSPTTVLATATPTQEIITEAVSFGLGGGLTPPGPGGTGVLRAMRLAMDTTPILPSTHQEGTIYWNEDDHTLSAMSNISGTTLEVGQEVYRLVVNKTGSMLENGTLVYPSGSVGRRLAVSRADADYITTTIGIMMITHDCEKNQECFATTIGTIRDLNTADYPVGTTLFLSTVPGEYTSTLPTAPAFAVRIGEVTVSRKKRGEIEFLKPIPQVFGGWIDRNYTSFDSTGFMLAEGEAVAWEDYSFGIGGVGNGAAAPDLIEVATSTIRAYGFDGVNTTEDVDANFELTHRWTEGTPGYPHVFYLNSEATAGCTATFQLEYMTSSHGGTLTESTTISAAQYISSPAWTSQKLNLPTIDLSSHTIGDQVLMRLFRDPSVVSDTCEFDLGLMSFGWYLQVDTLGGRERDSK